MCNKCLNYHKELFKNHQQYNIDKNNNDIFIDICKENGHERKLEFYCKTHNELCCGLCISKINEKGYGQHKDCDLFPIEDIKDEKKNKLYENIKYLQDLSNNLDNTINELKTIFENINKSKEELKLYVQKEFTKIRTAINEREDELLSEIDNKYNDNFCREDIIEESIKLPNKIKKSLEKGKLSDDYWNNNNKLSSLINDCINIENNIKNINYINNNIKNSKKFNNIKIYFYPKEESINEFIQNIKTFGKINVLLPNYFEDSLILKNKDNSEKLIELMSKRIKINKAELLYRATRDGHTFKNVVDKLKNKSNLIFIYLSGNERIFGNYLKTKLDNLGDNKDKYYKDENAFVFSLNNNKIYKILEPEMAIRFYNQNSPILTGNNSNDNGFYYTYNKIYDNNLLNKPKVYDFEKNKNELTDGKSEFNELEIFEIY